MSHFNFKEQFEIKVNITPDNILRWLLDDDVMAENIICEYIAEEHGRVSEVIKKFINEE